MSSSFRIRGRQHLPGGGHNSNGSPRQGKVQVWGKINVTNYTHGGESLTPADVGLTTIEWIDIKFDNAVGGNSGGQQRDAYYSHTDQEFYLLEADVQIAATADPVLSFLACGDTADDVELL